MTYNEDMVKVLQAYVDQWLPEIGSHVGPSFQGKEFRRNAKITITLDLDMLPLLIGDEPEPVEGHSLKIEVMEVEIVEEGEEDESVEDD